MTISATTVAATATSPPARAGSVAAGERIATIDVLRGFALFGILLVNMRLFSQPIYNQALDPPAFPGALDHAVAWLIAWLAEGKFYSLFSLLFGYGLTLQLGRAEARGVRFVPLYLRRLLVLFLIGLAHAILLWTGDILVTYAVLGPFLLLFTERKPRTLLIWAGVCLLFVIVLNALLVGTLALGRILPGGAAEIDRTLAESAAGYRASADAATRAFRSGDFRAMTVQRLRDLGVIYGSLPLFAPSVFAMFLVGMYAGKRAILGRVGEHLPLLHRTLRWGLGVGLGLNLVYASLNLVVNPTVPSAGQLVAVVAQTVGAPALCLGYAAALTLLLRQPRWGRRLAPLVAVGRLALSNYLLQTVICTTIFYGYGLGLYGRVGPAPGFLLSIAIYLVQLPLSVWWLRRFRFGPVEWLWRSLTYLRPQPFRVEREGGAAN